MRLPDGVALRVLVEDLDVALGGPVELVVVQLGLDLEVGGVDDDVGVDQLAELEQLGVRERGLLRARGGRGSTISSIALASKRLDRVVGDVGRPPARRASA